MTKKSPRLFAVMGTALLLGLCGVLGTLLSKAVSSVPSIQGQEVSFVGKIVISPSNPYLGPNAKGLPKYYELVDAKGNTVIFRLGGNTKIVDLSGKIVSFESLNGKWATFTGKINNLARPVPVNDSNSAVPYVDLETVQEIQSAP